MVRTRKLGRPAMEDVDTTALSDDEIDKFHAAKNGVGVMLLL